MPPRAQQRPPQSLSGPQPPNTNSPIAQLNPQQLNALQEHIRQTRATTGQEVTPIMITEWMMRNGINTGAPQQQQQQQQQVQPQQPQQQGMQQQQGGQQSAQQVQGNLDAVLHHLYPPHLANNPPAALAHLQNVLFPPQQGAKQSPFLQQVMLLAQNGRLSPEQMAQLKQAVALKNGAQAQQQQQQQQLQQQQQYQQQQQGHPQQPQMQAQLQQQQAGGAQRPPQQGGVPQPGGGEQPNATQAVQQLKNRVHHIEALLARPDVNDDQRAKMQAELDNARTNLSRVVKMLLAAQHQQQQQQQAQQQAQQQGGGNPAAQAAQAQAALAAAQQQAQAQAQAAAAAGQQVPGGAGGQGLSLLGMQEAQRQAMERKIQAAQQAQQQAQAANGGAGFRTASPGQFPGQPQQPGGPLRQSPSMGAGGALPPVPGGGSPQAAAQAAAAAAAQAQAQGKKLTKKQQADVLALGQQQAQQAQAQQQALAQAQAMAQAQAVAAQQKPSGAAAAAVAGGAAGGAGASGSAFPGGVPPGLSIPNALNVAAPTPEAFPPPRPTISGGLANSPSVSTPAITKQPALGLGAVDPALGGGASSVEALPNKDVRADDSKGRTVSKRKIREVVEAVDPEERLSDEVEDLLLEIADEFIDSVTRFGCQLAKHRKSDRLEVKDLALHLERAYNIRVPGFAPDEVARGGATGVGAGAGGAGAGRKVALPPGHAARLAAVRESGRRR